MFPCTLFMLLHPAVAIPPVVEVEEVVATYTPPNNGAGPLWCYGAPLIARQGDQVAVSVMETGDGVPLLCNTRWQVWQKTGEGEWRKRAQAEEYREREPCPLLALPGRWVLSTNPSTQPPGTQYGLCRPLLLDFPLDGAEAPVESTPAWPEGCTFTDHSYRGIAADRHAGEILLLNIDARTGAYHWNLRDARGEWVARGDLGFPIRSCYPQVALRGRAAHVLAIGDIVEPVEEWRRKKKEVSGREWDYVFRRLFYTWTPDLTTQPFSTPLELENVEATGGHITNLDLWLDTEGAAHLLWLKQPTQAHMRDLFFPNRAVTAWLEYCVMRDGQVADRRTLVVGGEGRAPEVPGYARFHSTGDGELWVVCFVGGSVFENRLMRVHPALGEPVTLPLEQPFTTFFTACERGGSEPSQVLDLFGIGRQGLELRYARVRLQRPATGSGSSTG